MRSSRPRKERNIMPAGYGAPFVRKEVEALSQFLNSQSDFTAKRADEAEHPDKQGVLDGIAARYARASEGLRCLADLMPEEIDPTIEVEREEILVKHAKAQKVAA